MGYKNTSTTTLKLMVNEYDKTIEKAVYSFGEEIARHIFKETFKSYDDAKEELLSREYNTIDKTVIIPLV